MGNPGIRKALTIEEIFLKDKIERRLYELREKAVRDEISMLAGARAEGEAKGIAKGRADAICMFLDVRFGEASQELQRKVRKTRCQAPQKFVKIRHGVWHLEIST